MCSRGTRSDRFRDSSEIAGVGYGNGRRSLIRIAPNLAPRLRVSDALVPIAILLWAIGVSLTNASHLGSFGLVDLLPVVFYGGVATLIASFIVELRNNEPSTWRLALHVVVLIVMLYGTAGFVYREGRYPWLYGTIGVVQYVNAHGRLDRSIDIYQNWPGFFAAAAWFDKVAGVTSPLTYAKWAQMVFELGAFPLLYVSFVALDLSLRQRWFAIFLYFASNWIAQDYFSPQALGTLLSLGVFAIACRYLIVHPRPRRLQNDVAEEADTTQSSVRSSGSSVETAAACAALIATFFVLTFTHELSPYIVVIQLGALAITRKLRPRWLPLVLAVIAIAYLAPRFSFVNSKYGLLDSIGKFFGNAAPPSATTPVTADLRFLERAADALSLFIWLLAILGAWMRRQAERPALVLSLLAFSPVLVLFLVHYGNEATLRVYLFSLPWSAALASYALIPDRFELREHRTSTPRFGWLSTARDTLNKGMRSATQAIFVRRADFGFIRWAVTLVVAISLFILAFFGDDRMNVMTPSEVATVTSFYDTAKPGPIYLAIASAPVGASYRYNLFTTPNIFGPGGVVAKHPRQPNFATAVETAARDYTRGSEPAYVLVTPSMYAYDKGVLDTPLRNLGRLLKELARSPAWRIVVHHAGTYIYEMPATKPGPRGSNRAAKRP
jgi:hypothetical protein